jgi:CheY-like chemotaxis protein
MGMIDLLLETDLNAEQKEYASTTRMCADRLLEILNATLDYSSLCSGSVELEEYEFSLSDALETAAAEHAADARAKNLTLSLNIDHSVPQALLGDARRLRQMLSQLIGNAVEFTHEGRVDVSAKADNERLSIHIRDTGIGIESGKLSAIFESFHQLDRGLARSYPGLGLGLPIARKIAMLFGGDIMVKSAPGVGSEFTVAFPLRTPPESEPRKTPADNAFTAAVRRPNILLVDDNEVSQLIITRVLSRRGCRVHCVGLGADAIEAAGRILYDLVLMDLHMPGMDGLETTHRLRDMRGYAHAPIIALTANASDQVREQCKAEGMQGFVSKPVHGPELVAYIERQLGPVGGPATLSIFADRFARALLGLLGFLEFLALLAKHCLAAELDLVAFEGQNLD